MPYGNPGQPTLTLLKRYAPLFGVPIEELGMEDLLPDQAFELEPDNEVIVSVVFGGVLDEEFTCHKDRAEFIMRVIAGQLLVESKSGDEDWTISLYQEVNNQTPWHLITELKSRSLQ